MSSDVQPMSSVHGELSMPVSNAVAARTNNRAPDPAFATRLRELVERLGRQRVATLCGVSPESVRLWCRFVTSGLVSQELLQRIAIMEGFGNLAGLLQAMIEHRRRRRAWVTYSGCAQLFAVSGDWPAPYAERQARLRRGERYVPKTGPRWMQRRDPPPDPPADFADDRVAGVNRALGQQGYILVRGADKAWHVARLGGEPIRL